MLCRDSCEEMAAQVCTVGFMWISRRCVIITAAAPSQVLLDKCATHAACVQCGARGPAWAGHKLLAQLPSRESSQLLSCWQYAVIHFGWGQESERQLRCALLASQALSLSRVGIVTAAAPELCLAKRVAARQGETC